MCILFSLATSTQHFTYSKSPEQWRTKSLSPETPGYSCSCVYCPGALEEAAELTALSLGFLFCKMC